MRFCNDNGIPHSEFLEWDAVDRAKQIAYMMEEGERCVMCGTSAWEWEADPYAYEAVDHFCQGCYKERVYSEGRDLLPGTTVRLVGSKSAAARKMRDRQKMLRD